MMGLSRRRFLKFLGIGTGAALIGGVVSVVADDPIQWQAFDLPANVIEGHSDPFNYFRRFVRTEEGWWVCQDIWADTPIWHKIQGSINPTRFALLNAAPY